MIPRALWPILWRLAAGGAWPPPGGADLKPFFALVIEQQLLPLLMDDETVPPPIAAAKANYRALNALYRKRFEISRAATLELLRAGGADSFLFEKGADYRHRLYDRPELRPMLDIDVLAPPALLPALVARLEAAGYPRRHASFGAGWAPGHYEILFEIGGVTVEIHRSIGQRIRAAIDYDGLWARREHFERDGIAGWRLSGADAVLAHAVNLAKDEFSSQLNRFVDFHLLLQRCQPELPLCVARAKAWGVERALFGALHITTALFDEARTAPAEAAMAALLDAPTRTFLVSRVLPDRAREAGGHGSRGRQLWRKFALMDRPWRRALFAGLWGYETAIGTLLGWRTQRERAKAANG